MVQIIPAILSTSENEYIRDISRIRRSEFLKTGWVHIDFADNKFVQNQTINPQVIQNFPDNLQKEAHLMVDHPKEWVDKLADAGFKRIIFHIECNDSIEEVISYIKSKGLEVGLALNNNTPIEKLEPFVSTINIVLIMTIVAGFQGQPFIPKALNKVREIKSKDWPVKVGVDGAVKESNIKEIADAGVDFVTVGSYLLTGDLDENLENLWEAAKT